MNKQCGKSICANHTQDELLSEAILALGSRMNRRGFLGALAKGTGVISGAYMGLFQIAGIFGTGIREAIACYNCWSSSGQCVEAPSWSFCSNADGSHPCYCGQLPWDYCQAICYGGHWVISCPDDCSFCDPCSTGC